MCNVCVLSRVTSVVKDLCHQDLRTGYPGEQDQLQGICCVFCCCFLNNSLCSRGNSDPPASTS